MTIRLKFNKDGFRELRTSAGAKALVEAEAEKLAARANAVPSTTNPEAAEPYYEVQDGTDNERARYRVRTNSRRSARHEAKTQALQKGL
jgi:molybdopterin/thiamine biosynthesis adenylyltransferase